MFAGMEQKNIPGTPVKELSAEEQRIQNLLTWKQKLKNLEKLTTIAIPKGTNHQTVYSAIRDNKDIFEDEGITFTIKTMKEVKISYVLRLT